MQFNEYQVEAGQYAIYDHLLYPFLGLAEEAGEVVGKVAKRVRSHGDLWLQPLNEFDAFREAVSKELGDVLWQLQECCSVMGLNLDDVAEQNLTKLLDRSWRNALSGEGDNR